MIGFTSSVRAHLRVVLVSLSVMALVVALLPISSSAAGPAATVDQCVNGAVGNPPTLEPCLNGTLVTSFSNWVNGDANASKSHWREGEFIPYRSIITGLDSSSHTLTFHYDTVHGSKHAIDYIGSYDATETTSPTATTFHRNDSNPCFDVLGTGVGSGCTSPGTPPTPASTLTVPPANLLGETTCAGASGSGTTPTQVGGDFKIFAPTASTATLTAASYPALLENVVSGKGQCSTSMTVTFSLSGAAPAAGWTVVLAWGGHIASQQDWGTGNSATSISGSPYHMILDSIDTTGIGSQDRALAASAIFFAPTISTTVDVNSAHLRPVPARIAIRQPTVATLVTSPPDRVLASHSPWASQRLR